jgi:hypothetical protein
MVRTRSQIDRVVAGVEANPGVVLFTMVNDTLRQLLQEGSSTNSSTCAGRRAEPLAALAGSRRRSVADRNLSGTATRWAAEAGTSGSHALL